MFKNTFYDKASGSALLLICSQFSTNFKARVLIKFFVQKSIFPKYSPASLFYLVQIGGRKVCLQIGVTAKGISD